MINLKTIVLSCLFSLVVIYFIGGGIFYSGGATDISGNGPTREELRQRFNREMIEHTLKYEQNLNECLKNTFVLTEKCGKATLGLSSELRAIEIFQEKNKANLDVGSTKDKIKKINRLAYNQLLKHYKDLNCQDYKTIISTYDFRLMKMDGFEFPNTSFSNPKSAFLATAFYHCFETKCKKVCQHMPTPYDSQEVHDLVKTMLIDHFTQIRGFGYDSDYFNILQELKIESVNFQNLYSLIKQHYPESLKNAGVYEVREEYWLKVYNSTPQ